MPKNYYLLDKYFFSPKLKTFCCGKIYTTKHDFNQVQACSSFSVIKYSHTVVNNRHIPAPEPFQLEILKLCAH